MDYAVVQSSCKKTILYRTENTAIYINPKLLRRATYELLAEKKKIVRNLDILDTNFSQGL